MLLLGLGLAAVTGKNVHDGYQYDARHQAMTHQVAGLQKALDERDAAALYRDQKQDAALALVHARASDALNQALASNLTIDDILKTLDDHRQVSAAQDKRLGGLERQVVSLTQDTVTVKADMAQQKALQARLTTAIGDINKQLSQDEVEVLAKELMDSTITVIMVDKAKKSQVGSGSGVVIQDLKGKQYILTNDHVVNGIGTDPNLVVCFGKNTGESSIEAYSSEPVKLGDKKGVARSDEYVFDLALFELPDKLKGKVKARPIWDLTKEIGIGRQVVAITSPYGQEGSLSSGRISHVYRDFGNIERVSYEMDLRIAPGSSGGMVADAKTGHLVGVAVGVKSSDNRFSYIIPASVVKPLLHHKFGLPFMTPEEAKANPAKDILDQEKGLLAKKEIILKDEATKAAMEAKAKEMKEAERKAKAAADAQLRKEHGELMERVTKLEKLLLEKGIAPPPPAPKAPPKALPPAAPPPAPAPKAPPEVLKVMPREVRDEGKK